LYRYEQDLAWMERELGNDGAAWDARAAQRKSTMNRLMWNEEAGLYFDLIRGTQPPVQNENEDLRSYMPLVVGMVPPDRAKKMERRIDDFMRPGGLATATSDSWDRLHALEPEYVDRCQWAHKDIGWPITTYETVTGLRAAGFEERANEIAYRWCHMVQTVMDTQGGLHFARDGFDAPVFEKMDVTRRSHAGAATVGYGNQGGGVEGEGSGFRWGYDAYKLLYRDLPPQLREKLRSGIDPDRVRFKQRRPKAPPHPRTIDAVPKARPERARR
jgi:alpha,alpha-trehalase